MSHRRIGQQPYPRDTFGLASAKLFPKLDPPLTLESVRNAIRRAFDKTKKTKRGLEREFPDSPKKLIETCLQHLKERNNPLGISFYCGLNASEIFTMDAVPHEMQRHRMIMGVFYQYLIIELMREASKAPGSHIISASDGDREGDVKADVQTPDFGHEIRFIGNVLRVTCG